MTSSLNTLNSNLERLKLSVKLRKRQRRNWMQRLMNDSAAQQHSDATDKGRAKQCESEVKLTLVSTDARSVAGNHETQFDLNHARPLAAKSVLTQNDSNTRSH